MIQKGREKHQRATFESPSWVFRIFWQDGGGRRWGSSSKEQEKGPAPSLPSGPLSLELQTSSFPLNKESFR